MFFLNTIYSLLLRFSSISFSFLTSCFFNTSASSFFWVVVVVATIMVFYELFVVTSFAVCFCVCVCLCVCVCVSVWACLMMEILNYLSDTFESYLSSTICYVFQLVYSSSCIVFFFFFFWMFSLLSLLFCLICNSWNHLRTVLGTSLIIFSLCSFCTLSTCHRPLAALSLSGSMFLCTCSEWGAQKSAERF